MNIRKTLRQWAIHNVPKSWHRPLRLGQFAATINLGRALRALPGTSRQFGPPRRLHKTLRGYARDRGYPFVQLCGPVTVRRSRPPHSLPGDSHPAFGRERIRVFPPIGVAVIEGGRVVTRTGAVIGPEDTLIGDVSGTFMTENAEMNPLFVSPRMPPPRRVDEIVAVLATYRSDIYSHWLFDTLPRFALLRDSGLPYDKIVIPASEPFQRRSLDLLGIEPGAILSAFPHVEARRLLVPTLPAVAGNPARWACDFLRRSFLDPAWSAQPAGERIYVSRGATGTRRITNETALCQMLEQRGFRRIRPETLSFDEQVRVFDSATVIVAAHGSGLSNLVFCRPGTSVIEIFHPLFVAPVYWTLANLLDLDYSYVLGEGRRGSGGEMRGHEDITVDVGKVGALVERAEQCRAGESARGVAALERPRTK